MLTPNPLTSGGARWNVLAAYGAQLKLGKTPKQAEQFLYKLFHHVPVQDKSARDALTRSCTARATRCSTYENEALLAQPTDSRLLQHPEGDDPDRQPRRGHVSTSKNKTAAQSFVKFLYTPTAQKLFAQSGYRPVLPSATKGFSFPVRPKLFTIDYLGGWTKAQKKFFDPNNGLMAKIEASLGG